MSDWNLNAELNTVLIRLGRSLLQYAREAWPWTDETTAETHAEVDRLAERQSQLVADMTDWLEKNDWPVEFGVYSADFTDLHYVSLAFLLNGIARDAESVMAAVEVVAKRIGEHTPAAPLLKHVLTDQKTITANLRELAAGRAIGQPA